MQIKIKTIEENKKKSEVVESILEQLPEWFGNEIMLKEYVEGVKKNSLFGAFNEVEDCIGFVSLKTYYDNTGDIYVCGVLPQYHNQGIGKKIFSYVEEFLKNLDHKYLIVKTLSDSVDYKPYNLTRAFYERIGFKKLITLTEMWDEDNPCLIMIKNLN